MSEPAKSCCDKDKAGPELNASAAGQQATEGLVARATSLIQNPMFMMWMWFIAVPWIKEKMGFSTPTVDADGKPIELPPPEPFEWNTFITKFVSYGLFFIVCMLLMIYFKQETMLYVPGTPF
jgi:hypothetical protein